MPHGSDGTSARKPRRAKVKLSRAQLAASEPGSAVSPLRTSKDRHPSRARTRVRATRLARKQQPGPPVQPVPAPASAPSAPPLYQDSLATETTPVGAPLPDEAAFPTETAPLADDDFPSDLSEDFTPELPKTPAISGDHAGSARYEARRRTQPPVARRSDLHTHPAPRPRRRRWRILAVLTILTLVVTGGTVTAMWAGRTPTSSATMTVPQSKDAIQREPLLPSPLVDESLDELEATILSGRTTVVATANRLFDTTPAQSLQHSLDTLQEWVEEARAANQVGLLPPVATEIVQISQSQIAPLQGQVNRLEELAGNWDLGQRIAADLTPLTESGDVAVAVWDAQTHQPIVQIGADEEWTTASTFKIFVAYSILKAIDEGEISPDRVVGGYSLEGCFTEMITQSHNDCAEEWLYWAGYDRVEAEAHEIGANDTYFSRGSIHSTANDLQLFFQHLHDGTILSDESRDYLIEKLATNDFRHAIPAQMYEDDFAINKVGFLDQLHHDIALVYTPNGDYTIAILTDGMDWEAVREAAAVIRADLEPSQ